MNKKFIKVHQTNLRSRYKYFLLKDEFIDENILKNYFEKREPAVLQRLRQCQKKTLCE